jgi:RNA-directed DNA polymerase
MIDLQPGSETGACTDEFSAREPGDLQSALPGLSLGEPLREAHKLKPEKQGLEESDELVVPGKFANAGPKRGADGGKELGQGERVEDHPRRTQGRPIDGKSGLRRVSEKAKEEAKKRESEKQKFTNLFTHLRVDLLREVYFRLKRKAASGVDGMSWNEYGEGLEERLNDLQGRLHRGAYQPLPVRRVYIPKADGKQRPLGIPAIEDKIVQGAVVAILTPIYEAEFLDCSYGFRPNRNQHMALEAIDEMIVRSKVNWLIDGDIKSYFDTIDHDWLTRMLEHRIGDKRLVRLIRRWLKAGVLEDETLKETDEGSPQGGLVSPLLANIYLHYVLDVWLVKEAKLLLGAAKVVRYADDFLIGLEHEWEAKKLRARLEERFNKFGLVLHPEKTKTIRFGRFAARDCVKDGQKRPTTFDFLGFTHICGVNRKGKFQLMRRTSKKKRKAKLAELKKTMRERMHWSIRDQWQWLSAVLRGHFNYYGVPTNFLALRSFHKSVRRAWLWCLQRRSQRAHLTRARQTRIEQMFPFPRPKINRRFLQTAFSLPT